MNIPFTKSALPALISSLLILGGCGSSGDSNTGSINTDIASTSTTGIITGFGSIFVNGIEFETSSSSFDVDDDSNSDQSALRIGMRVKVKGTVNKDGLTGSAESVVYQSELKGPVSALTQTFDPLDPTLLASVTLTILGQQVTVNTDTTFDDDYGLMMGSLQLGDVLEISGFSSVDGIIATHIEKQKAGSYDASDRVEIKGEISNPVAGGFEVRGISIVYDSNTSFDDGLTEVDLVEGLYVEVKGTFDVNTNEMTATRIEAGKDRMDDNDNEVEIEGLVADFDATAQTFSVQGQVVDYSQSPLLSPLDLQLANDMKVEVEGTIIEGTLVADKIKQRGQKIKVQALIGSVNDIDSADPSISLSLFGGTENITVRLNQQTEMKDNMSEMDMMLNQLMVGDFVEVKAFYDGTEVINAIQLERDEMDKVRLQGPLSEFDESLQTLTLFGQSFDVSQAEFQAYENENLMVSEFYAMLTKGIFIKLTDKEGDGVIDEVELDD